MEIEEFSKIALVKFDTHTRFKTIAARGNVEEGLRLLAKLYALQES